MACEVCSAHSFGLPYLPKQQAQSWESASQERMWEKTWQIIEMLLYPRTQYLNWAGNRSD